MKFTPQRNLYWKGTVAPVNPTVCEHIPGLYVRGTEAFGFYDQLEVLLRRNDEESLLAPLVRDARLSPKPEFMRSYQYEGINWLVDQLRREGGAILADDMGLGKTLQTLETWAAMGHPQLLVCAPASVRRTWKAQFQCWVKPSIADRITLVETGAQVTKVERATQVVVTSYELAQKLPALFVPQMLVLDEAHRLRSRGAKTSLYLRELAPQVKYKLALTGTPLWGYNRDLWNLLCTLFGYRFGTAEEFDYAYCGAFVNKWGGKENKGATRTDELKARLKYVMLRRTKSDVKAELPALTRDIRYVEPTKEAREFMKRAALKQCSFQDALAATLAAKVKPVVDAVLSTVNAFVVTWRKEDVRAIRDALDAAGRNVVTITGDDSHRVRDLAIKRAVEGKHDIVATIDSVGTGVDGIQHCTSNGFFHALDYTPIKTLQCEARLHRTGQPDPVTWTYFVMTDSADELVKQTVIDKLKVWEQTMGRDEAANMQTSLEDTGVSEAEALAEIYAALETA